jgi:hypothetical protein
MTRVLRNRPVVLRLRIYPEEAIAMREGEGMMGIQSF